MKIGGLFGRTDNSIQAGDKIKVKDNDGRLIKNTRVGNILTQGAGDVPYYTVIRKQRKKKPPFKKYLLINEADIAPHKPTLEILEKNAAKYIPYFGKGWAPTRETTMK